MRSSLHRLAVGILAASTQITLAAGVAGTATLLTADGAHAAAGVAVSEGPAPQVLPAPGGSAGSLEPSGTFSWPGRTADPAALAATKSAAAARVGGVTGRGADDMSQLSGGESPATHVVSTMSGAGLAASDQGSTVTPPDTTGAIGPTRYVEAVNNLVRVYDRNLNPVGSAVSLINLFNLDPACRTTDPQFEYDPVALRWYYAGLVIGTGGTCQIAANNYARAYGWSNSTDPAPNLSGSGPNWCKWYTPDLTNVYDYPKLGHSNGWLAIGTNVYANGSTFTAADVMTISKPANGVTTCSAPTLHDFPNLHNADSTFTFTPVPASNFVGNLFDWVVSAHYPNTGSSAIQTWYVNSTGFLVRTTDIAVNGYGAPPNIPQPGTGAVLDSSDTRLTQAIATVDPSQGGKLAIWTDHAVTDPALPSAPVVERWYEIIVTGTATGIAQQGDVYGFGDYVFDGAISPTASGGDAVMSFVYVVTGGGGFISKPISGAMGRRSITPPNTLGGLVNLAASTDVDVDFSCSPCRWGDYAGATPDPSNPSVVWGTSQWTGPTPSGTLAQWKTINFALTTIVGGNYTPLTPARILDTRFGNGAPMAPIGAGASIDVQVTGRVGVPASGVAAVVINITATNGTQPSYFTAWPTGTTRPLASNINFLAFQDIANLAIVTLGTAGKVSLYNSRGSADAVFDVQGWFSTVPQVGVAGLFNALPAPNRILDTRMVGGPFSRGEIRSFQVTGTPGVPAGASSVVINVTAVAGTLASYLTVWPADATQPTASNLNFSAGRNLPNRVIVKLSGGGSPGQIKIYNNLGSVDVLVDVTGYFTGAAGPNGGYYNALQPNRLIDTRVGLGGFGTLAPNSAYRFGIAGAGNIPLFIGLDAVLNITITNPTSGSYLTVFPGDAGLPIASDLNFGPGDTVANLTVVRLDAAGFIWIYNNLGNVDVIADEEGWFG